MAYNGTEGRAEYTASAGQTLFPFGFKIFFDSDIKVYLTPDGKPPSDLDDLLILTTDYTVSTNGDLGGVLTLANPSSVNDSVTIVRSLPVTRPIEYQTNGDLLADTLNTDQDYQTYLIADRDANGNRYLSIPDSAQDVSTELPTPEALKLLGWNSAEDALINYTFGEDGVAVNILNVKNMETLLSTSNTIYETVNVRGYHAANNGGGGLFNYDPIADKSIANGGTIVDPTETLDTQGDGTGNGCWIRQYSGKINAKWFGATGDGVTDDTVSIKNALNFIKENQGVLFIPVGTYKTTEELVLDKPGMTIIGEGTGTTWDGLVGASTIIEGDHTLGSVIRIKWENCILEKIVISSSTTRATSAINSTPINYNAGVRIEADDVPPPEGDVFSTNLRHVYVRNQPNDGIILIGRVYGSVLEQCYSAGNNGHGFVVNNGRRTGRTNTEVSGLVTVIGGNASRNQGHGMLLGSSADVTAGDLPSFRCLILNWESNSNEVSAALREDDYSVWAFGDQNSFINCAFSGKNSSDVVQLNSGLCLGGRDSKAERCRYLDCSVAGRVRHITGGTTTGILFDRMAIRNSLANFAVTIDLSSTFSKVDIVDTTSVTAPTETIEHFGDEVKFLDEHSVQGGLKYSDYRSARRIPLNDDSATSLLFSGTTYGVLVINGNTSSAGAGMVAFRVGSSIYTDIISVSGVLEASTGVLTGITGNDGKLTISGAADNKLYIENRTGVFRTYTVTLLSVDSGGRLSPNQ